MSEPLDPQGALETAVRDAIRAQLSYPDGECEVMFDEQPPPSCGERFVSVWSDGSRQVTGGGENLGQRYNVNVTLTVRLGRYPKDRWVMARREITSRMDAVVALVHVDRRDWRIVRAANALAGRGKADNRRVGFCEGLECQGIGRWQKVGPEWFGAEGRGVAGVAQTATFGGARLIQASLTAG